MSRIGLKPIKIENGVTVTLEENGRYGGKTIVVKGPKGELKVDLRAGIDAAVNGDEINLSRKGDSKILKSYHGLYRTLTSNMIEGVVKGYTKELEIVGVGYRVSVKGKDLELTLGFNHPVIVTPPDGIEFKVTEDTFVTVSGIDKELVGNIAAKIKSIKKPEPYKGKGIRYKGEFVRRKAGKTAA